MNWEILLHILEAISFIATTGLCIVAAVGLKQLRISKQVANISAKRDAIRSANEQVQFFIKEIIPSMNELNALIKKKGVTFLKDSKFTIIKGENIEVSLMPRGDEGVKQFNIIGPAVSKLMNDLELAASVFVSGLADERVGFKSIGKAYCNYIETFMPVMALANNKDGYYQNAIELYRFWNSKFEKLSLEEQQKRITEELSRKGNVKKIIQLDNIDSETTIDTLSQTD